jgi:hypothetical protein
MNVKTGPMLQMLWYTKPNMMEICKCEVPHHVLCRLTLKTCTSILTDNADEYYNGKKIFDAERVSTGTCGSNIQTLRACHVVKLTL